jgi:predicted nucleic acid-binding protein
VRSTLIDAGPIIALFDGNDKYHNRIVDLIKQESFHLVSTWPVLTEASHMLDFDNRAPIALLQWIYRGGLELAQIDASGIQRIIDLTEKYNDVPMDLADATLVVAAENLGIREIISIDTDFYIYRTIEKEMITNIFKQ